MRIRSKLGLILLVPLVVLVAVASLRLYDLADRVFESGDMVKLVEFNTVVAELRYDLQRERSLLVTNLRLDQDHVAGIDKALYDETAVSAQQAETDESLEGFNTQAEQLPALSDDIDNRIDAVHTQYESLRQIREQAKQDAGGTSIDATSRVYQRLIAELVTITDISSRIVNDPDIARNLQAIAAATTILETLEEERAIAINVGDGRRFINATRWQNFISYAKLRETAEDEFKTVADRDEQLSFFFSEGGLNTAAAQPALEFENAAVAADTSDPLSVNAEVIDSYNAILDNGLRYITDESRQVLEDARNDLNAQVFQLLLEAVLILAAFVMATVIALLIARNMATGLRRLREGALDVAHVSLPQAVAQMRDAETIGNRTPDEVAADTGAVIDIDQRDEIGNVAHSFNIVHTEAIRIAAEQAALRANVSQMFINLARRSQNLVDRLIGHLDHLERGEENPDRLAELFQLDHLATRMRRNDENLLVLAGADSTRQERYPAPIGDILQAAQSEVEQYTRIEFGNLEAEREIRPAAVNDLVHLIAELMDNATAFSPPESPVLVEAEQMRTAESPQGAIRVRINDVGIGMPPAQIEDINRQLSESADVIDLASSRMMGLVVVARLARRHDVRVELRAGEQRGTVAEVILGEAVLTEPRLPERGMRSGVPLDAGSYDGGETMSLQGRDGGPRGELLGGMHSGELPRVPESPAGLFDTVAQPGPHSPPPPQQQPLWQPSAPQQPSRPPERPTPVEPLTGEQQLHRQQRQADEEPGFMFRPGGLDEERKANGKVMEVTGEIVSSEHVALPKIQLEAFTPEPEPAPPSWPDVAAGPGGTEAPRAAKKDRVSALDATTELPIFREVESAWFKAVTPAPKKVEDDEAPSGASDEASPFVSANSEPSFRSASQSPAEVAETSAPRYADQSEAAESPAQAWEAAPHTPPQPTEGSPMHSTPADEPAAARSAEPGLERRRLTSPESESGSYAWRTAADDGWSRVDNAFAETVVDETTTAGLPKRRPMERLVPGSVEESQETVSAQKRNPEGIRGLLSAYHRGVQRGRGNDGN
ncbi:nitrate- and nitrite sensing domain-containing protein [Glycomyces sp. TRM65418]|uniref:sensor histidine kinase n=1 Tax=Glycomyces sp. TRM65418 TaxID=2867006 RepID=UPI001CE6904F|nr:nitrate- and nitrite sensing domain-containing protein [Glycomyces sp. TRM65418]MCC3762718.1 nitrate- and nitrite sensing domain-containing protein [Glycomyces sp. TRM65418]QZD56752.1 nitrate- and nitrite sensing domain-containing protein [Glycomyces sp. TRM65418]